MNSGGREKRDVLCGDHEVQLFDSFDSRVDAVSAFIGEGLKAGDAVLAVCTGEHWKAIAPRLGDAAVEAASTGRLVRRDAAATLRLFMQGGTPSRERFETTVGALVPQLASGGRLRVYGEMVDLLAGRGEFEAARELEDLWNALAERCSFRLYCGYAAVNFGDPRAAEALRSICGAHSRVRVDANDALGSFLLNTYDAR